jgi:hypothetical protein
MVIVGFLQMAPAHSQAMSAFSLLQQGFAAVFPQKPSPRKGGASKQ